MKNRLLLLLFCITTCPTILLAQDWTDIKEKENTFFVGLNIGTLFANNNTASIYDGSNNNTPFGVEYIMNIPSNKIIFKNYFQQTFSIAELPLNPTYKTALDIGLHAGINISKVSSIFVDMNISSLSVQQLFTILIDDPTNLAIEPNYEQLPIIGEEKRININVGTQLNFFNRNKTKIYGSFFGNFNNIKLLRNYIVINNREYEIFHASTQQPNIKPSGSGYGGGIGLGIKYNLTDKLTTDFTYNFYYIKTSINDKLQGFGINHGLTFRLLWEY